MTRYHLTWTIDLDADTPEDAARKARRYQLDPGAEVGAFDVLNKDTGMVGMVDLDLLNNEPQGCAKPAHKPGVVWYPPAKRKRETKWHRASPITGDEQRAFCNYNLMLDLEQPLDNEQIHSELRCKRCMTETGLGD